jgi:hypothetical protein
MASRQDFEELNYGYSLYKMDSNYTMNISNDSGLTGVHYLDASVDLRNASAIKGAKIRGVGAVHAAPASFNAIYFGDNGGGKGIERGSVGVSSYKDNIDNHYGTGASMKKDSTTSKAFIWQSWFLDGTVAGLWSVRNDSYIETFKERPMPEKMYGNQAVGMPFSPDWGWDDANALRANSNQAQLGRHGAHSQGNQGDDAMGNQYQPWLQ